MNKAEQIIMTAKIGDGCFITYGKNYCTAYSSIKENYMHFKKKILEDDGFDCSKVTTGENKGYNKNGIISKVCTHVDNRITKISTMTKIDVIDNLDYFGFLIYYLDDGAYHKSHNTMHLYCNSFTDDEVEHLKNTIYRLFPYKECRNRWDNKKNGNSYPYLYMPVDTVKKIVEYYKPIMENEPLLFCMLYKMGLPSQTIKSNKCNSLTGE